VTPGETLGVVSQSYPDEPYIDRLPQTSQPTVTMRGHLILGQDAGRAHLSRKQTQPLFFTKGGWQLILMALLPWTTQALLG
jgi:hypothetical protein